MLAIYAGSFDPVTLGHVDILDRASKLFDQLIVAIGKHPGKNPLFTIEERTLFLQEVLVQYPNVKVETFDGLLIDFCKLKDARVIVRGLRAVTDFEFEFQIAHANADMAPEIDTIFLPTRNKFNFISASLIREIASHGGIVSQYVPPAVYESLKKKFLIKSE